jgi:hypothetical protein
VSVHAATDIRVTLDGRDVSSYVHAVMLETAAGPIDITTLGSVWWSGLGGIRSAQLRLMMWADFDTAGWDLFLWDRLGTVVTFEVWPDPTGSAARYTGSVLVSNVQPFSAPVGQMAEASFLWPAYSIERAIGPELLSGMGVQSNEADIGTTDKFEDMALATDGAACQMFRIAHGGSWRPAAPSALQTFTASEFGLLNTAAPTGNGKLRAEVLKWIAVQHANSLPAVGKFGLQYGTNMAIGAPTAAENGPRAAATGAIDAGLTFASRAINSTFGVDPLPLGDVNSAGAVSYRYITAPWGRYDATLADGSAASRFHAWLEMDLQALEAFFDEDCEHDAAYTVPYDVAHKRRVHFPWLQVKPCVNEASLEYSRGLESTVTWYPAPSVSPSIRLGADLTDSGTTVTWSGAPPTGATTEGDQWSPLCVNGVSKSGQWFLMIFDVTDPANTYEVFPVTAFLATAADLSSGTITVQSGGRGKFGPPARAWTAGANIRIAIAQWTPTSGAGSVRNKWIGRPGLTGVAATETVRVIDRSSFLLSDYVTVVPTRTHNYTAFMVHAWEARANLRTWKIVERDTDNVPQPEDYPFDGTETNQELENLVCKSWARHAIDAEFMVAAAFPNQVQVVYYGTMFDAEWAQRWTGSAAANLTRTIVEGWTSAEKTIPDNSFMAQPISRATGSPSYEYPADWRSASKFWSPADAIFHAVGKPGLWSSTFAGWESRFAHGITHLQSQWSGSAWSTPWEVDPEDYGAWSVIKLWWLSPAKLVFQFKGVQDLLHGSEVVHTCEDAADYDIRPVVIEGPYLRYTADLSTADPADVYGDFTAAYLGWLGSVSDEQVNYLVSTANSIGQRMRDPAYLATT